YRLLGMGDLDIAVRDPLNQTNLYQLGGISAGLGLDQDSTSVNFRAGGEGSTRDIERGTRLEEIDKSSGSDLGIEGVLRFSETLAFGIDGGLPSQRRAVPYSNDANTSVSSFDPAANVMMSGRLFGPVLWGANAHFAGRNQTREYWSNELEFTSNPWTGETKDYRLVIDGGTGKVEPPHFFEPTDRTVKSNGLGGSLAYQFREYGEAAFYLSRANEDVEGKQVGQRQVYDTFEKRHINDFGFAFIGRPTETMDLGVALGRSTYDTVEDYRFSVSGGSTGNALQSRGDRSLRNFRADYLDGRFQGDLLVDGLTLGADLTVAYERWHETAATTEGNFNDFVLTTATVDTLVAPPLVRETLTESRVLGFGLGASYALQNRPIVVGAEYHWRRDAQNGTMLERRPQGWSVRLGGEWVPNETWTARAGWVHEVGDEDRLTTLNEGVADRVTLGGGWHAGAGWTLDAFAQAGWGRTDYPDPLGPLEKGWGLGAALTRLF
ncbi:MAG: hypothetical protein ACREKH_18230, partial [Candidatus Rokuibacteriota bacterium]